MKPRPKAVPTIFQSEPKIDISTTRDRVSPVMDMDSVDDLVDKMASTVSMFQMKQILNVYNDSLSYARCICSYTLYLCL